MIQKRHLSLGLMLTCLFTACALGVLTMPEIASADSATTLISEGLDNTASDTYSQEVTATVFIGNLIRVLLSATGIIFLILTVYAGILYMTAAGAEDKVKKSKSILTSSLIGLIIIVGAYAITGYVIDALAEASSQQAEDAE